MSENGFVDSYDLVWELEQDNGEIVLEYYYNISLGDFEVIYGNNVFHIRKVEMRCINGMV